jgi:hypothetical protein
MTDGVVYVGRISAYINLSRTRCSMYMDKYQTESSPLLDAFGLYRGWACIKAYTI